MQSQNNVIRKTNVTENRSQFFKCKKKKFHALEKILEKNPSHIHGFD